jgi:hypothetical protein
MQWLSPCTRWRQMEEELAQSVAFNLFLGTPRLR